MKAITYFVEERAYFERPSRAIAARCFSAFLLDVLPGLVQCPQTPGLRQDPVALGFELEAAGLVVAAAALSSRAGLLCFFFDGSVSTAFLLNQFKMSSLSEN